MPRSERKLFRHGVVGSVPLAQEAQTHVELVSPLDKPRGQLNLKYARMAVGGPGDFSSMIFSLSDAPSTPTVPSDMRSALARPYGARLVVRLN